MNPKILLVEDDLDLRKNFETLLVFSNYIVTLASNGAEGFDFALKQPFDLVITDIMMPIMDGNELIKNLSKMPQPPPVIVLTASLYTIEPNILIKETLRKPVPLKLLLKLIQEILNTNADCDDLYHFRIWK